MVQYFCAIRGLQQCKHCPVTLIQNEQGGLHFLLSVFRGESGLKEYSEVKTITMKLVTKNS